MTLPNFFIVGAAKSGTTSLYFYLRQHPEIFMAQRKEPSYFLDWIGGVHDFEEYIALFTGANEKTAVGEASTGYLYDPAVPIRIKQMVPNAKILIILRQPVEMCFALWRHMRRIGKRGEWLSFEAALAEESGRMSDEAFRTDCKESWHANFYYFHRALYYPQVKRYMDTFGRESVQVHLFEDFKADPQTICARVFAFLGVSSGFRPSLSKHNVGVEVRHRGLDKLLKNPPPLWAKIGHTLPENLIDRTTSFLTKINCMPPPLLKESIREDLLTAYSQDVESLGKLIGRDLSCWKRGV